MNNENKTKKGKFIVIEGADGSGKSLVINKLKELYKDRSDIIFVKEPSFSKFGGSLSRLIKSYKDSITAETKMYLFMAARCELIDNIIIPALNEGKTVICERFALSTYAYQCSEDDSLIKILTESLNKLSSRINVDYTFYINCIASDLLGKDAAADEIQRMGALVIWYNMGSTGATFPTSLIGKLVHLDYSDKTIDKANTIKNIIDNDSSNS